MPGPMLGTKDTDVDKTSAFLDFMLWLEGKDNKQAHRSYTNRLRVILEFYSDAKVVVSD